MASRDDGGQMILLAGILLVIAFIAFTIQLSVLPNLGQQQGREAINVVTEDHEDIRRLFASMLEDELRSPDDEDDIVCIDGFDLVHRVRGHLSLLIAHEGTRGHAFGWERLSVVRVGGSTTDYEVAIDLRITDGISTISDQVTYPFDCNTGVATGCFPACVVRPTD